MKTSTLRLKFIQFLISLNEKLIFYPKLKSFYIGRLQIGVNRTAPIVVFDVGANRGQTIDFFLKIDRSAFIYAFEPNPLLYHKLLIKYGTNNNVRIYNLGISNINGEMVLNETVTDETSSFEELNFNSKYLEMKANILGVKKEEVVSKRYSVNVARLVDFIRNEKINYIDVMKIDTEGHELKCLFGLFPIGNCDIKFVQLEKHNDDMYLSNKEVNEVPLFLNSNGYNKLTIVKHGFGDIEECIYEK